MLDSKEFDELSPKSIDDIVGNTEIWKNTEKLIKTNSISHIVLVGPAGCGKSTFIRLCLSGFSTLFLDCTANFGLRENRDVIRLFSRGSRNNDGMMRWVILEHADSLTADTQAFLRRMLETTSATTRFLFECKDAGAITEPIYSRAQIIHVNSPDLTESIYEIQRRTDYGLSKKIIENIVKHSYGNLRSALNNAFAIMNCNDAQIGQGVETIESLLSERPAETASSVDWIQWVVKVEEVCRSEGIDIRDILRRGWPNSTIVSNTCSQWSRLGGSSTRALFVDCVSSLINAEK